MTERLTFLRVDGFTVLTADGCVYPEAMTIFREGDRREQTFTIAELYPSPDGRVNEWEREQTEDTVRYCVTALVARARLEVMGFTLRRLRVELSESIARQLAEDTARLAECDPEDPDRELEESVEDLNRLAPFSIEEWVNAYGEILRSHERWWTGDPPTEISWLAQHLWTRMHRAQSGGWWFPFADLRAHLRLAVEACAPEAEVHQDVTRVPGDRRNFCSRAQDELLGSYPSNERIVVLTEGSTDARFIRRSLEVLYPHLVDYYTFMDFMGTKAQGGAPALVLTLKAFAGSGIRNRIVALFDNDTAAHDAVRSLGALPANYRVVHYPALELAKAYPTLGPQGQAEMDVNGLAGSLELYFGLSVLERDGKKSPVQWKGYVAGLRRYQGEVLGKTELQDLFERKLEDARSTGVTNEADWADMRLLLSSLIGAFD